MKRTYTFLRNCLCLLVSTFICTLSWVNNPLFAQEALYESIYRPKKLHWQQINSPHFKVVFPRGFEKEARRTIEILESELPKTNALTGGSLKHIPVVLNTWNDRSNGYVTPLHFRIEVELPPILGKALNQANGDWLSVVMPHELVHASHGAVTKKRSLYGLVRLFSPDLYRATNFSAPSGHIEGIAVHHESDSVITETGRGNYADFVQQFNAVQQLDPWSMGQLYFPSQRTLPFNRHYIGGWKFSDWLIDTYGTETIAKTHETLIRFPFIGFGAALKVRTGKWPHQLYNEFQDSLKLQSDIQQTTPLINNKKGAVERRPQWLSDDEIVYYGQYYNEPGGFFSQLLSTAKNKRLNYSLITRDYRYSIDQATNSIYYGAELQHPYLDQTTISTLHRLNVGQQKMKKVNAAPQRVYAPEVLANDSYYYSIQRFRDRSVLLKVDKTSHSILQKWDDESIDWVAIRTNPTDSRTLAIIAQYYGKQAIWITRESDLAEISSTKPTLYFHKHSLFDIEWHPNGHTLIFSSDHSGVRQLYAYSTSSQKDELLQLTASKYGAMEASFSPNGRKWAYVELQGKEYRIIVENYPTTIQIKSIEEVEGKNWTSAYFYTPNYDSDSLKVKNYYAHLKWLKPRSIQPVDTDDGYGLNFSSNDLLRQYSYSSDITFFKDRIWYNTDISLKPFYPGLDLSLRSFPIQTNIPLTNQEGETIDVISIYERKRFDTNLDFQWTFRGNIRPSFVRFQPGYRYDAISFYDNELLANDRFGKHAIFSRFIAGLGLLQSARDIMPRSGWVIQSEMQYDYQIVQKSTINGRIYNKGNAYSLGLTRYINVLPRRNQQISISSFYIRQNNGLYFDAESFIHPALEASDIQNSFGGIPRDLLSIQSKWIIPIKYPDNGWALLPAYIGTVYLSLNHNSVMDITSGSINNAFHLVGGGLRTQLQFAQIRFDLGIGVFYDTSSAKSRVYAGAF